MPKAGNRQGDVILAHGRRPQDSLLQQADHIEQEQPALLADLSARLFPRSQLLLDEATVASVRAILFTLVGEIENDLAGENAGIAWPIIARSRLLETADLLRYIMAHAAWLRVAQRVSAQDWQRSNIWLSGFAADDNSLLGQTTIALLYARSRSVSERLSGRRGMPAMAFRHVVQQVDAALRASDEDMAESPSSVRALLAAHDEGEGLGYLSTRMAVQLRTQDASSQLRDPRQAGLDLFAGYLSVKLDCPWHDVVQMMGEGGARFALLLRAASFPKEEALHIMQSLAPANAAIGLHGYDDMSRAAARRQLAGSHKGDADA